MINAFLENYDPSFKKNEEMEIKNVNLPRRPSKVITRLRINSDGLEKYNEDKISNEVEIKPLTSGPKTKKLRKNASVLETGGRNVFSCS